MSTNYTSVAKGFKLKVKKFYGLISTFAEVTEEKLIGGLPPPPPPHSVLNRANCVRKYFELPILCKLIRLTSKI